MGGLLHRKQLFAFYRNYPEADYMPADGSDDDVTESLQMSWATISGSCDANKR